MEPKISTKIPRAPKFVKKDKSRLPRLEKKALQKKINQAAQAPVFTL